MNGPRVLPLFPLTGSLLLPGGLLPLHIFEPRYCNLVEDALAAERLVGMVQPRAADPADNRGQSQTELPELYAVGCAGLLDQVQELPNGRYLVILKGRQRFRLEQELELQRGYRRAEVSYDEFDVDRVDLETEIETQGLLTALENFGSSQGLTINIDKLEAISGLALMNGLAMNLPFAPAEKQALLEAGDARLRYRLLLDLLAMGFDHDNETAH